MMQTKPNCLNCMILFPFVKLLKWSQELKPNGIIFLNGLILFVQRSLHSDQLNLTQTSSVFHLFLFHHISIRSYQVFLHFFQIFILTQISSILLIFFFIQLYSAQLWLDKGLRGLDYWYPTDRAPFFDFIHLHMCQ